MATSARGWTRRRHREPEPPQRVGSGHQRVVRNRTFGSLPQADLTDVRQGWKAGLSTQPVGAVAPAPDCRSRRLQPLAANQRTLGVAIIYIHRRAGRSFQGEVLLRS